MHCKEFHGKRIRPTCRCVGCRWGDFDIRGVAETYALEPAPGSSQIAIMYGSTAVVIHGRTSVRAALKQVIPITGDP
jgi:hypothetical protein